jgi:hypothetical protein
MFEQFSSSSDESRLGERLRREALESRPAFSETLHRRIVAAVESVGGNHGGAYPGGADILVCLEQQPGNGRQECLPHRTRRWKRSLTVLAAAACLLCAAAIGWGLREGHPPRADIIAQSPLDDLALIHQWSESVAAGLDDLVATVELTPPPARLSSDARLTAETLIERLPVDWELASE